MSVAFVHHFKTQVGAVKYISPSIDHATLGIQNRLVKVEAVEVERHGADSQRGEPDTNYWPSS